MKLLNIGMLILACCWSGVAGAQLQLLPDREPQRVFAGADRKITVVWHNAGDEVVNAQISARIFQTSSATAVRSSEVSWKQLQVLPQQTIVESAGFDFPVVKAGTKFLIQWLENTNRIIGKTETQVYPTNLFQALQPFVGETNFGVLDPGNRLKPLLKAQGVRFVDLGETELDDFSGQLAVIGPFQSRAQVPDGLANRIEAIAKKNVAVVWIQPSELARGDARPTRLSPSFYCVQKSQTVVVVVQPDLVSDLAENPQSQLNLIYFCQVALNPQPSVLPGLSPP
jgi:hypothetical protein